MVKVEYTLTGTSPNIKLEMKRLVFPNRCACCGTPNPGSTYKGAIGIITGYESSVGRQTTKYIWKEWSVPYCSFCLEHDKENLKRSDAMVGIVWGTIIWLVAAVIGWASLHLHPLAFIAIFLAGLGLIYFIWGRQAFKKTERKPSCYVPSLTSSPRCFSINDGKFSAKSPLTFTFHDPSYEKDFLELNGLAPKTQVPI